MDRRLLKRHKRQVSRARERIRLSEPDLRTPEQIRAAREASRGSEGRRNDGTLRYIGPSVRSSQAPAAGSTAKTAV
jgi:hypothetical protein